MVRATQPGAVFHRLGVRRAHLHGLGLHPVPADQYEDNGERKRRLRRRGYELAADSDDRVDCDGSGDRYCTKRRTEERDI